MPKCRPQAHWGWARCSPAHLIHARPLIPPGQRHFCAQPPPSLRCSPPQDAASSTGEAPLVLHLHVHVQTRVQTGDRCADTYVSAHRSSHPTPPHPPTYRPPYGPLAPPCPQLLAQLLHLCFYSHRVHHPLQLGLGCFSSSLRPPLPDPSHQYCLPPGCLCCAGCLCFTPAHPPEAAAPAARGALQRPTCLLLLVRRRCSILWL